MTSPLDGGNLTAADLIVRHGYLITMDDERRHIEDGAIAIARGPTDDLDDFGAFLAQQMVITRAQSGHSLRCNRVALRFHLSVAQRKNEETVRARP